MHVLVLDSDPQALERMSETLEALGYRVTTAGDLDEAWTRISGGGIHVAITDWTDPGIDGLELCRRVRAEGPDPYVYMILVTARTEVEAVMSALASGADEVLRKPVVPFELATRLESIDRLRGLHRKVARQNRELRAAQQFQDDWIHMIVHDLRGPLTVVLGSCELMQLYPDKDHGPRLDTMIEECERLHSMLEQMLIAAKSQSGRLTPAKEEVDPAAILGSARAAAEPIAGQRDVRIRGTAELDGRRANLDRSLFRRAVDNLISNAIKYGPADSEVTLTAAWDGADLVVEVADEGEGVKEEDRERLFERYGTLETSEDVQQIGLGLAFCRMVAEAHGGCIDYVPRDPRGSLFRLRLPVSARPAPACPESASPHPG